MAKSIRANLELVSENEIGKIVSIDARKVSSQPAKFIQANLLGYYVLINTWLLLIKQYSQYGWVFILNHIKAHGLFETIKAFDNAAGEIVHASEITFGCARTIWTDVQGTVPLLGIPFDNGRNVIKDPMAAMLLICRYPKRFSPLGADLLKQTSIDGFIQTQRRLKSFMRTSSFSYDYIIPYVREAASHLLKWDKLISELLDVSLMDIEFTPGVSFDTRSDLVSKLQSLEREHAEYFYQPFGIPLVASAGTEEMQYWGRYGDYEVHTVRLIAVPKTYKAARVIAPENVYRQALARRYFTISDRYLPTEIMLHDQSQNQDYAYQGSITGRFATLDLSAASDSMTRVLLSDILPKAFMDVMDRILPTHYEWEGKRFFLHSAATMGNSMTFWLESVVFASVTKAAIDYYRTFAECDDTYSVYGDDIIVPTEVAPLVIEWLTRLGFLVNEDKSFFDPDHRYRESCGEEYFEGTCVSSVYFPRFPLEGQIGGKFSSHAIRDAYRQTIVTTMSSMIDLQHKLFYACVPAGMLIAELVTEAEPRMTTSTPEMGLMDLWSYDDHWKPINAPAGYIESGKVKKLSPPDFIEPRHGHLAPYTSIKPVAEDPHNELLVKIYQYQQFLAHGPRYDDALMKLLGITMPPLTFAEARSLIEQKWGYVK